MFMISHMPQSLRSLKLQTMCNIFLCFYWLSLHGICLHTCLQCSNQKRWLIDCSVHQSFVGKPLCQLTRNSYKYHTIPIIKEYSKRQTCIFWCILKNASLTGERRRIIDKDKWEKKGLGLYFQQQSPVSNCIFIKMHWLLQCQFSFLVFWSKVSGGYDKAQLEVSHAT